MPKFRKRPVVIEAIAWTGDPKPLIEWAQSFTPPCRLHFQAGAVVAIPTLEGEMTAQVGDWIIRGVAGEFYPCKPEIFAATYEPVEETVF